MVLSPTLTRPALLPNREQIHKLFQQGDLVPVYRTLLADLETPVSVYLKLAQTGSVSFLLESVEGGERVGRYSFLGVNPKPVLERIEPSVYRLVAHIEDNSDYVQPTVASKGQGGEWSEYRATEGEGH